VSYKPMSL